MTQPAGQRDEAVNLQIRDLQRRFPAFDHARRRDAGGLQQDPLSQFFTEHILLGDKLTYDCILRSMLTDEERARLETDPRFTKAWRIFVDLCWVRRQFTRAAIVAGGIV